MQNPIAARPTEARIGYATIRDSAHPWWSLTGRVLTRTPDSITIVPPLRRSQIGREPLTVHLTPTHTIEEAR